MTAENADVNDSSVRWYNSIQFHFISSFGMVLLLAAIAAFIVVQFIARNVLVEKNKELIQETGAYIVAGIEREVTVAHTLARALANLGEILPKDEDTYHKVVPHIMDMYGKEAFIAGGGIWPEPGVFTPGVARRSFFWGREPDGSLKFFDDYNHIEGNGYHNEEWYVPGLYNEEGKCYWSKSYMDPYSFEPMVTCTVTMFEQKEVVGTATVDIRLSGLRGALAASMKPIGGYAFALDRNNRFLSFPQPDKVKNSSIQADGSTSEEFITIAELARTHPSFSPYVDILNRMNQDIIDMSAKAGNNDRQLAKLIADGSYQISEDESLLLAAVLRDPMPIDSVSNNISSFAIENDPLLKEPVVVSIFLMPKTYWKIAVVVPERNVIESAKEVSQNVLAIFIVILLVAISVGFLLLRNNLIKPLDQLVYQLKHSDDEFSLLTPGRNVNDEFALLTSGFNLRTVKLQKSHKELEKEINEHHLAQVALQSSEQRYRSVIRTAPDAIITVDCNGSIVDFNPATINLFQYERDELKAMGLLDLFSSYGSGNDYQKIERYLSGKDSMLAEQVLALNAQRKDNSSFPIEFSIASWRAENEQQFTCFVRDVTLRKEAERRLRYMALHDALTGLPNRTLFKDRLQQAMAYTQNARGQLALMFIDLDNFKFINDSLGHEVGDKLLIRVADRVSRLTGNLDVIARLGGDEFAFIQVGFDSLDAVIALARQIVESLRQPFHVDKHDLQVGASIGITIFPDDGDVKEVLLRNADMAMYQAKAEGRNTWCFFAKEMNNDLQRRNQTLADLTDAMEKESFDVVLQPIVDIQSGELIAAEALLRWFHSERGMISPDEFIPVAEQSGLIFDIGKIVIRKACQHVHTLKQVGCEDIRIAINFSPIQFRHEKLVESTLEIIEEFGLSPTNFECEITETAVMDDVSQAIKTMHELHSAGFKLSIDDFGTGYSSLSYLKRFPIDKVKIDRSFVSDIDTDSDSASIARAVVNLGHSLGLVVLAEGVETERQRSILIGEGCDLAQGYLIGKPMKIDDFVSWNSDYSVSIANAK
ncbi:EAL domain-containing protein [Pleionea sp. CnH1-48]|uniref:EAL domain-containing protein n=1 Tax=Pleionea sp. CnH1-48 TaxID=2954494 RepID=UPI00209751B9|nr:EAL domain-containing protein [Pleionea sp. CnH1-48]MCO7224593.1 EAL domain-containing protein [Pleionea sp. CnH1-48]